MIVVSPLVALMEDEVRNYLKSNGLEAAYVQGEGQDCEACPIMDGEVQLLYMSLETFCLCQNGEKCFRLKHIQNSIVGLKPILWANSMYLVGIYV